VDTEREGAHAVGNLPQRVRQRRVAGIIILDRAVKHRHTEPVMAAAREAGIPIAFAGQGGHASLARAFAQLELALGSASVE
jgi:DNA-binding LacI/PurR family transcriptional regulator